MCSKNSLSLIIITSIPNIYYKIFEIFIIFDIMNYSIILIYTKNNDFIEYDLLESFKLLFETK